MVQNLHQKAVSIARKMVDHELNHAASGNLSFLEDGQLWITRRDVFGDELTPYDFVPVDPKHIKEDEIERIARDCFVHQAIYENPKARVVLHAHPTYTIALTMTSKDRYFIPVDDGGKFSLSRTPVIGDASNTIGSPVIVDKIAPFIQHVQSVIIQKHGVFVWAGDFDEAYRILSTLEYSAKIKYLS